MPDRYVVLGDVVQSRDIEARPRFRETLDKACDRINHQYEDDIDAPFRLLKGIDELGAVLTSASSIYDITKDLFDALHPHQLRLAVVFGEIDVGVETGVVSKMDGPAFHQADDLIDEVEQLDLFFDLQTGKERFDLAVADEINLLLSIRQKWTDRQREIINCYRRHGIQYEVADELGISQQAVSKALQEASWSIIRQVEKRLSNVLEEYE